MKFPNLAQRLKMSLQEDGAFHDVTSLQIPRIRSEHATARLLIKQHGVFCGGFLILAILKLLDPRVRVRLLVKDGHKVRPGQTVARISAKAAALLAGERLILNLVTHLSGIATLSNAYLDATKGTGVAVLDTRKTTPLWRDLEKYAVKCGGGENHRFSLSDAVLVKDNHHQILARKGMSPSEVYGQSALGKTKRRLKFVSMEAADYKQVWAALRAKVDIILLDNMPVNRIKGALLLIKAARTAFSSDRPLAEVSGGVTLKNVKDFAKLGIDRISVGALTHSAPALDMSLEVD